MYNKSYTSRRKSQTGTTWYNLPVALVDVCPESVHGLLVRFGKLIKIKLGTNDM